MNAIKVEARRDSQKYSDPPIHQNIYLNKCICMSRQMHSLWHLHVSLSCGQMSTISKHMKVVAVQVPH